MKWIDAARTLSQPALELPPAARPGVPDPRGPWAPSSPSAGASIGSEPAGDRRLRTVEDFFLVTCPYCGEEIEIYVEPDTTGTLVQDCEVCCNPWRVVVADDGDTRSVHVGRADGSE